MNDMLWAWVVTALVMLVFAGLLGKRIRGGWSGALIDNRGRYSLTQFQIVLWTIVLLSLITGVWFGRLVGDVADPLGFDIPSEVLLLMGISLGSTAAATVVKTSKDQTRGEHVIATPRTERPRWEQMFMVEEGADGDVVDVTKFQNFWLTLILVVGYVVVAADMLAAADTAAAVTALPKIDGNFVTLLGISHAGYLAGKLPNRKGPAPHSYNERAAAITAARAAPQP